MWIPVEPADVLDRRFPVESLDRVLFVVYRRTPFVMHFVALGWWAPEHQTWVSEEKDSLGDHLDYHPSEVTHWCPLPKLPSRPVA